MSARHQVVPQLIVICTLGLLESGVVPRYHAVNYQAKDGERVAESAMNGIGERDNRRSMAWRIFFEASTRLQGIIESRMKSESGISLSDYNILLTLYEAPDRQMRMGELADYLGYSPSRLTYLVNQLSREAWVERAPSDDDRRGYVARLTESGIQTTEMASRIHQEAVRELLLDDMTDAHIDMIVEAFGHLDDSKDDE